MDEHTDGERGDTLYLGVVGRTLTVKLNGTTIKTLTDTSLTAGYAGIDVTNYDAGPVGGSQCDDWEGGSLNALSKPTNVAGAASSSTQINLGWTAPTGSARVAGYTVLRNGVSVGTSTTTSYADAGLTLGTSYTYAVSAFDDAGNFSDASADYSHDPRRYDGAVGTDEHHRDSGVVESD